MKLETIKKDKKKNIIIGSMIVLSVVGCLTLTTTRAKYRGVQSLKLASGTVNFKASDLHIVAVKTSEDGTNYIDKSEIPTSGYTLNTEKSKCRIPTSTLTGENAPEAEGVMVEYIDDRINVLGMTKKNTKCYLYFDKILSQTVDTMIAGITVKTGIPDFSKIATTDEGIYKVADGMYNGDSYYWRGAATTNHVIFDSKCWRIVRINGDKTIRLIYNGTPSENTCPSRANSAAVIMGTSNAEKYYATNDGRYNNSSYVGWTYTLGEQRTTSGTASNVKIQTEKWYDNNISVVAKAKVDTAGKFCNDRNTKNNETWKATGSTQYYEVYTRIYETYAPTLNCSSGDVYTLSVGAISADEVEFAGGKNENNTLYYLNAEVDYWTMSPSYWHSSGSVNVFVVSSNGFLTGHWVADPYGFRPVINLRSDVTFNSGSDGTQNNPYIVQ